MPIKIMAVKITTSTIQECSQILELRAKLKQTLENLRSKITVNNNTLLAEPFRLTALTGVQDISVVKPEPEPVERQVFAEDGAKIFGPAP
jgi:hypothetical protein